MITDKLMIIRKYYYAITQNVYLFNEVGQSERGLQKETLGTHGFKCSTDTQTSPKVWGYKKWNT